VKRLAYFEEEQEMYKFWKSNEQVDIAEQWRTDEATHLVDLRNVIKEYNTPAGTFRALDGIDLAVDSGEFVAVVGKSGSGKSTLTNMITGIDRPSSGEVLVTGTPIHKMKEGQIAVWRGRNVGVVFQFFQLLPTLTVIENVMLPMDFGGLYGNGQRRERALHLLDLVEMADQADKLPTAISGGQQQRVAIARSLANDPPLLVADEPTGNLDSKTADSVFRLFEELVGDGKTILMVTHDDELASRASRAVTIADGRIASDERSRTFATAENSFSPAKEFGRNGAGNGRGAVRRNGEHSKGSSKTSGLVYPNDVGKLVLETA
jgi:putative ABC transport system ATP-binding protein